MLSEPDGTPSAMRYVVVLGAAAVISTFCYCFVYAQRHDGKMVDVPTGTCATFGTLIGNFLLWKFAQKTTEVKNDAADKKPTEPTGDKSP
jgi:hypothetical protein